MLSWGHDKAGLGETWGTVMTVMPCQSKVFTVDFRSGSLGWPRTRRSTGWALVSDAFSFKHRKFPEQVRRCIRFLLSLLMKHVLPGRPSRKRSRRRKCWKLISWSKPWWSAQDLRKLRVSKAIRKALKTMEMSEDHAKQYKTDQNIMAYHGLPWRTNMLPGHSINLIWSNNSFDHNWWPGSLTSFGRRGAAKALCREAQRLFVSTSWAKFNTNSGTWCNVGRS